MNILLNGISGFMGREVAKLCEANYRGASLVIGVDPKPTEADVLTYSDLAEVGCTDGVDCIIDFSHHTVTPALLDFAVTRRLPLVLCTTGHTEEGRTVLERTNTEGNIPVGEIE